MGQDEGNHLKHRRSKQAPDSPGHETTLAHGRGAPAAQLPEMPTVV
jgi:hypothetical protein